MTQNDILKALLEVLTDTTHAKDERITHLVEVINVNIEDENEFAQPEKAEEQSEVQIESVAPASKVTMSDLIEKMKEVHRAQPEKKAALKALLKYHGAERTSDIAEDKIAEVFRCLDEGDF